MPQKRKELPFEELVEIWQDDKSSGDYIAINDDGDAYQYGKLVVEAVEDNPDWKGIRAYCDKQRYWPNVWRSNDHGNGSLYTLKGQYVGGIV